MMKIRSLAASFLLAMTVTAWAVAASPADHFKDLMRKEFDAWSTLDTDKVAHFYAQGPENVFYDITPLKYNG